MQKQRYAFAFVDQSLGSRAIHVDALALHIRSVWAALVRAFVPIEAKPVEDVLDLLGRALNQAGLIGVLDAQDQRAAAALALGLAIGKEVVEENGAATADMERAGRAGRKPNTNGVC